MHEIEKRLIESVVQYVIKKKITPGNNINVEDVLNAREERNWLPNLVSATSSIFTMR